jgi:hypothetical protein
VHFHAYIPRLSTVFTTLFTTCTDSGTTPAQLRALFPQSAQDLDQILDPERHKSVDAVNAGVGRLLQQLLQQLHERNQLVQHLHHRQIALNEMSLSSQVQCLGFGV